MRHIANQTLSNEPIVITIFSAEWSMARDVQDWSDTMNAYFDALDRPHCYVMDLTQQKFNVGDVILGANTGARSGRPVFHHPNMIELFVVTHDKVTELAAKGMNSPIFGFVRVSVYDSMESAMAAARDRIAQNERAA